MNVEYLKLIKIDHDNNCVTKENIDDKENIRAYVMSIIEQISSNVGEREYEFKENELTMKTLLEKVIENNDRDAQSLSIAKRLLDKENEAEQKYHQITEIQRGILLIAYCKMAEDEYKIVICKADYTEFIEDLYGAKKVCYIHGCRKNRKKGKPDEIILGHVPGLEEEQWDKVELKFIKFKNPYKRYIFESAMETATREAAWYDESTTKKCSEIIKKHSAFFEGLSDVEEVYVIGHSLSEVDYPYFDEVNKHCNAKWIIGYHSYEDMKRLVELVKRLKLKNVTVFRT